MDVLDSRDLQERIEELETELEELTLELDDAEEELDTYNGGDDEDLRELQEEEVNHAKDAMKEWKDENQEELDALNALKDYCGDYGWISGIAFIAEEAFEEYVQGLAADLYGNDVHNDNWPFCYIDWEKAADALRQDYSSIDYRGTTYLFRS